MFLKLLKFLKNLLKKIFLIVSSKFVHIFQNSDDVLLKFLTCHQIFPKIFKVFLIFPKYLSKFFGIFFEIFLDIF